MNCLAIRARADDEQFSYVSLRFVISKMITISNNDDINKAIDTIV